MLDHVGFDVSDYERSRAFYEKALAPLGMKLLMEPVPGAAASGTARSPSSSACRSTSRVCGRFANETLTSRAVGTEEVRLPALRSGESVITRWLKPALPVGNVDHDRHEARGHNRVREDRRGRQELSGVGAGHQAGALRRERDARDDRRAVDLRGPARARGGVVTAMVADAGSHPSEGRGCPAGRGAEAAYDASDRRRGPSATLLNPVDYEALRTLSGTSPYRQGRRSQLTMEASSGCSPSR